MVDRVIYDNNNYKNNRNSQYWYISRLPDTLQEKKPVVEGSQYERI